MNKTGNSSLKFRIQFAFIVIILTTTIIFIYSNVSKNNIINEYNEFMEINMRLNDLSVEFNDTWKDFDSYMKSKNLAVFDLMGEHRKKINDLIREVEPYVKKDRHSSTYLRNLVIMNEWFQDEIYDVIIKEVRNEETYESYQKLRTMNYYISNHSRSLVSSFLKHTDSYYYETLDNYKILDTGLFFLLAMTLFINIIILKIVNDDIIKTISDLSIYAKKLSAGEFDTPDLITDSYRELDNLSNGFNHMKKSINQYIEELNRTLEIEGNYQKEKIKNIEKDKIIRETQLKAMQMQINPHFLFNNLNTVSRVAMFEGADQTVELIDSLSKILRFNLTNKENLITLEDELTIVKAYIAIQKVRYEDRVCFDFNIDESLNQIHIPPMIIQLIIENAIKHGFSGFIRRGCIVTTVGTKGQYLKISIRDNGNGIQKEELECIRRGEPVIKARKKSSGLGFLNIKNRLELYFNRNDLLEIESQEGVGTEVVIWIPIEESEKIVESTHS